MKLGLWSSPEDAFLEFVYATEEECLIQLIIRSKHQSCCCPDCGKASFRSHSHYTRIIQDLPIGEKAISQLLISRKWFCDNPIYDRKIFTERYDWIAENGRRTMRAEGVLREIAFSSSCLNGEKLARPNSAADQAEPLSGSIPETKYQRQRWERYEKKWALIRQIQEEHQKGENISVLAREFQLDRRTIRKYLNTTSIPIITRRKSRRPINDFYEEVKRLEGKKKTVKEIYSLICNNGYTGTFSGVRMTVEKIRKERKNLNDSLPQAKLISRKKIGSLLWRLPVDLIDEELRVLKQIFERYPELETFYQSVQTFRKSIKDADYSLFLSWLREKLTPDNGYFHNYALQLRSELQVIKQSFLTCFSNGPVEGHIHRLKLLNRMMYGQAKIGLLEKRVLYHL